MGIEIKADSYFKVKYVSNNNKNKIKVTKKIFYLYKEI